MVKAIQRPASCFVSRLHLDTKEEELATFLGNAGIENPKCIKLKPKDGMLFKTAAFRVECDFESEHLLFNNNTWPSGAEVREWFPKNLHEKKVNSNNVINRA